MIANFYYGNWPATLDQMIHGKELTTKIIKRMKKRLETVAYHLKNPILKNTKHKIIIENVMIFIYNDMEETDRNKIKESIIGEQNNVFLKKETIYLYPFESIMKLNSTRGSLFVVQNWERIVQLPNFVNQ